MGARARIGTKREDLPWVEEEFDPEFRQWIEDFSRDQLPEIRRLLEQYGEGREVHVFHSRAEADDWLPDIPGSMRKGEGTPLSFFYCAI